MTDDQYVKKYVKAIKSSKTKEELSNIVNRVYEDGFHDGTEEGND